MDLFWNGELSLSGPGCQSQSRRLLKEKKKASYSSQIPEMSRHPWEGRAMKQNRVMKEESHDWVPWKNKTSYYIKKSHFMFPLEQWGGGVDRVRSAGCRQRRWPGISNLLLYSSTQVIQGQAWHTPIKTHPKGGAASLFSTSVSLFLFCYIH